MTAIEGYKTLLLAVMAFVYGIWLLWDGQSEHGTAFVGFALAQVGLRHTTSGPAAWRQPPRPKRAPRRSGAAED